MSKSTPVSVDEFRSGWLRLPDFEDDALDARLLSYLLSACEYLAPKVEFNLIGDDEASPPTEADRNVPESVKNAIQVFAANLFTHPVPDDMVSKAVKTAVERLIAPYRVYKYPNSGEVNSELSA
jgi:hypothetical protein